MKKTELEHTLHNVIEKMANHLELVQAKLNDNPEYDADYQDLCSIENMFNIVKAYAKLAANAVESIKVTAMKRMEKPRWSTRLRVWQGDAVFSSPTMYVQRDRSTPQDRQRHAAYYQPDKDAIYIAERHPHGKAIWWHEQAHRLMCRNLGEKAFSRSAVDAEMRADAVACAMVGTEEYLKCMESMRQACEDRLKRRAAAVGYECKVDRMNLEDMEKRIAFIRENVHI